MEVKKAAVRFIVQYSYIIVDRFKQLNSTTVKERAYNNFLESFKLGKKNKSKDERCKTHFYNKI